MLTGIGLQKAISMANNKMLIDAAHPEETRVVMVRGNRVDEFDFESEHKTQLRGNIYLAKVTRVEPSLQAAFIDYGGNRHGFLAFSEIHPDYYQIPIADRQALLDAEAEDARAAAEAEAAEEMDDAAAEINADGAEPAEKPARKRRSRRRGGKKTAATEDNSAEDNPAEVDNQAESSAEEIINAEPVDAAEDRNSAAETSTDDAIDTAVETDGHTQVAEDDSASSDPEDGEENDDNKTQISAENDGEDVVSQPAADEPAKKPRRRTSRKKPAKEDEAATADTETEAVSEPAESEVASQAPESEEAEETPKKKPRRRTSRKKAEPELADASDNSSADAAEAAEIIAETQEEPDEKPRRTRRRTSRKKESAPELEASDKSANDAVAAESGDEASTPQADVEAEDKSERKPKSRSRSRRRKKPEPTDKIADDLDDDNDTPIESIGSEDSLEEVPVRRAPRRHYKIQEVIKRRQILLVQVVKEERGNKGAALTTYLSLAGRYSVLMPNTARGGGISRKITNTSDRKRLKAIASELAVPQGMGVILRTAGASRQQDDIQRDFEYLMRLWENVRTLTLESSAPCLVYEEGNLIKRSIRDLYDKDTGEIMVAGEEGFREAKDFMTMLMPNHAKNVKLYRDKIPMFARMGVEAQLDAMLQPQVTLKSGGYLILDQTEALVAIDVNSGRSTRQHSIEETAVQTNLEAADEVARQLRLRDLAGLIVIDFIDMEEKRNIRAVEKRLKDALKNDRARIQVGRISHFGLMEMSRQRIRASVLESTTQTCPTCEGLGHVRAASSIVLAVLRAIEEQLNRNSRNNLTVKVSTPTALYLLNNKRDNLGDLESRFGVSISIATDDAIGTTPCVIERGEQSNRKPAVDSAVQPDTINPQDEDAASDQSSQPDDTDQLSSTDDNGDSVPEGKNKRRRRRRKRGGNGEDGAADNGLAEASVDTTQDDEETNASTGESAENGDDTAPKRIRRKRRKSSETSEPEEEVATTEPSTENAETVVADAGHEEAPAKPKRRRTKKAAPEEAPEQEIPETAVEAEEEPASKRRTTRRKKAETEEPPAVEIAEVAAENDSVVTSEPAVSEEPTPEKPTKTGWWQRKFF